MTTYPAEKNRRWIWYFVVVFAMAFIATAVLIMFNLGQQLKPDALSAARKHWLEKGPLDYTMSYTQRVDENTDVDHYWVKVRGGKVVEAKFNGQPEAPELYRHRSMDRLFDFMDDFMREDSKEGSPKTYVRAIFDDQGTGRLFRYVRRVMGGRHRVEITVETFSNDTPKL